MHLCPHCERLGISTYAAIGDPFSRGLASCKYCNNVSRRRPSIARSIGGPVMAAAYVLVFFLPRISAEQVFLWLAIVTFVGFVTIDRHVDFEKLSDSRDDPKASLSRREG